MKSMKRVRRSMPSKSLGWSDSKSLDRNGIDICMVVLPANDSVHESDV